MDEQTFLLQFNRLPAKPVRKAGAMPGLIVHMADDFNEPLEDEFKEYRMP